MQNAPCTWPLAIRGSPFWVRLTCRQKPFNCISPGVSEQRSAERSALTLSLLFRVAPHTTSWVREPAVLSEALTLLRILM